MPVDFTGRIVLITGAGRGLGAAYARIVAQLGGTVVVHDAGVGRDGIGEDPGPAESVTEEILAAGGKGVPEVVNLNTADACTQLVERVIARFGRLDALIHNAGIVRYGSLTATTPQEWESMRLVSVDAPFWLCRAAWPQFLAQDYGRIVLTASGYGLKMVPHSDVTAYGVGKAAQFGLMNGLAGEAEGTGIRVNIISPVAGTRIFRDASQAETLPPETVARGVALLASDYCPWNGKVLSAAGTRFRIGQFRDERDVTLPDNFTPDELLTALSGSSTA